MICHCQTPCRSHRFCYRCYYCHCTRNLGHSCSRVPETPSAVSDKTHHEKKSKLFASHDFTQHICVLHVCMALFVSCKASGIRGKIHRIRYHYFGVSLHTHKNIGFVNEVTIRNGVRKVGPSRTRKIEYGLRCCLQLSRFCFASSCATLYVYFEYAAVKRKYPLIKRNGAH